MRRKIPVLPIFFNFLLATSVSANASDPVLMLVGLNNSMISVAAPKGAACDSAAPAVPRGAAPVPRTSGTAPILPTCVTVTQSGVDITLKLSADALGVPSLPQQLDCARVGHRPGRNIQITVTLTTADGTKYADVECDLTAAFIYAQAFEHTTPSTPGSNGVKVEVPWNRLPLALKTSTLTVDVSVAGFPVTTLRQTAQSGSGTLDVADSLGIVSGSRLTLAARQSAERVAVTSVTAAASSSVLGVASAIDHGYPAGSVLLDVENPTYGTTLTLTRQSGAAALHYSPYARLATPLPSPSAAPAPLDLHSIGGDLAYLPTRYQTLSVAGPQNDANVSTQQSLSQILKFAPIAIPSTSPQPLVPQTLQGRSGGQFNMPASSMGLVDPALKPLFDTSPFSLQKVSTLNLGSAYAWSTNTAGAAGLYGIKEAGGYVKAYQLSASVPPPEKCLTPPPSPTPSPTQAKILGGPIGGAPPGPVDDPAYAPSTIAVQHSDVFTSSGRNAGLDRVNALDLNFNLFAPNCHAPVSEYESQTVRLLGSLIEDGNAKTAPGTIPAVGTAKSLFTGESSAYTLAKADSATFLQLRETAGFQKDDPLFSPANGSTTFMGSLSGPFAHGGLSFAAGKEAYTLDLFAYRLTNIYGDLATDASAQIVLPIGAFSVIGGDQVQSVSDRVAIVQQGQTMSYGGILFAKGTTTASADNTVRPETQKSLALSAPIPLNSMDWQVQLTAGAQEGVAPNCTAPSPPATTTYMCQTSLYRNGTWGISAKYQMLKLGMLQLGFASTSETSGALAFGSSSRYFGAIGGSPGSVTSYVTYTGANCSVQLSGAYTNATYSQMSSLPQEGVTTALQADIPIVRGLGVSVGYSNLRSSASAQNDQSAVYVLFHGTAQNNGADWDTAASKCPASVLMPSPKS